MIEANELLHSHFSEHLKNANVNDAVYLALRDTICTQGAYASGTRLASAEIAKTLEISSTPVQTALVRLEANGLLRRDSSSRYVYMQLSFKESRDLNEYMLGMYEQTSYLAQDHVDTYFRKLFSARLSRLDEQCDLVEFLRLDNLFHGCIVECSGNQEWMTAFERITLRSSLISFTEVEALAPLDFMQEHRKLNRSLVEALQNGSRSELRDAVGEHNEHQVNTVSTWFAG